MDGRFNNPFMSEQEEEDPGITTTTTTSSPTLSSSPNNNSSSYSSSSSAAAAAASAMAIHHDRSRIISSSSNSLSSPKKSNRRSVQKRVVSIPIGDVDGTRLKGEGAPPSDSWAWRKYGQKPIKGSPYPRGYYRCSSSKGCPARKQVERSRVDPTVLVITYACEHNHPWPASRNSNSTSTTTAAAAATTTTTTNNKNINITTLAAAVPTKFVPEKEPAVFVNQTEIEPDEKFGDLGDESMITVDDFGWFSDVASTSPTVLESPICLGTSSSSELDADMAMIFPMREEDESLFADLGELPECSFVFRRGFFEQEEERRRSCSSSLRTASWCGSTG